MEVRMAFTYHEEIIQRDVLGRIVESRYMVCRCELEDGRGFESRAHMIYPFDTESAAKEHAKQIVYSYLVNKGILSDVR